LASLQVTEESLPKHLIMAHLISWLLASTVNLIGLSVMDVLLSLINHIMRLLQPDASKTSTAPSPAEPAQTQEQDFALPSIVFNLNNNSQVFQASNTTDVPDIHKELLQKLTYCVGNLGTHIYYSDQIADMITEILVRLKPVTTMVQLTDGSANGSIQEKINNTDETFSFAKARTIGLKCIKEILVVANGRGGAQSGVGRNGVPLSVWDGTSWLLREEDKGVRKAYADAFTTYLKLEANRISTPATPASPKKVNMATVFPQFLPQD